jgi:hypothetical protein
LFVCCVLKIAPEIMKEAAAAVHFWYNVVFFWYTRERDAHPKRTWMERREIKLHRKQLRSGCHAERTLIMSLSYYPLGKRAWFQQKPSIFSCNQEFYIKKWHFELGDHRKVEIFGI